MNQGETLLDLFTPPEGRFGYSGALLAMTASEDFLEAAVQRFTGLGRNQRAALGETRLYLLLDPHASGGRERVLQPGQVPGLHEFQPRQVEPTKLLHAKLCLLAFSNTRSGPPVALRLAVLTANFTYASARQQLELVWRVDVPLGGRAPALDRADVVAAAGFLEALVAERFHREEAALAKPARCLTRRWDALLAAARKKPLPQVTPRFMHTLEEPLFEQIQRHLQARVDAKRNLLLVGSGFYEQPGKSAGEPKVLAALRGMKVFTDKPTRIAVVDPREAGAIARWAQAGTTQGWKVVAPSDPLGNERRLHAKFIYVGYLRDDHVSNGWLYLGSGNLSRRGLRSKAGDAKGNVECGVLFEVPERIAPEALEVALFWRPGTEPEPGLEWKVGRAGDEPDTEILVEASPVLSAAVEGGRKLRLDWREGVTADAVELGWTGAPWRKVRTGAATVPLGERDAPDALRVRSGKREWSVPVVDGAGRTCWKPPAFATSGDALAALLDFPIEPAESAAAEDADDGGADGEPPPSDGPPQPPAPPAEEKTYALHAAAELVERVAELQRALPVELHEDWLDHLDRTLRGSFPPALLETWRARGIDVLRHLGEPEFRPPDLSGGQLKRYRAVLDRAAARWGQR